MTYHPETFIDATRRLNRALRILVSRAFCCRRIARLLDWMAK